jgi:hypothetical protein
VIPQVFDSMRYGNGIKKLKTDENALLTFSIAGAMIGSAISCFLASGEGGLSGAWRAYWAQVAWTICSKIGTATRPPVWPPPSVRRRPSELS